MLFTERGERETVGEDLNDNRIVSFKMTMLCGGEWSASGSSVGGPNE